MENTIEKMPGDDKSNLANNCGQFFTKGPALTKDIITKVQRADLVNKRNFVCGYEFKSRHIWVLVSLFMLLVCSLFGTITFWCTNFFDQVVLTHLELVNGSESYNSFTKPGISPYVKVYIFNYTNVDDFERGRAEKLNVQEIGPYVFEEHTERINTVFGDDGTLTFQERRSYKFIPELSEGHRQSDQLVVPNLPMLGTVAMVKDTYYMTRLGLSTVLQGLNSKAFLRLPAHRFIWGYDDSFFNLVKSVLSFQKELPFEKFGLLASKNGTSPDRITIATGENDINTVGTVIRYNGEDQMNHWSTKECNRIDGTLGAFFSPYLIREKKPISIYQKDLCRKLSMKFDKEVKLLDTFSAYRYTTSKTVFSGPTIEATNQCFCDMDTGVCLPHGIINATPCSFGPAYLSFPHFLYGDPELYNAITGLKPDEEKHNSYLDIHPTMGFTMAGNTRLQLNIEVRKVFGIPQVNIFEDKTMLPVAWFDSGVDPEFVPEPILQIYHKVSFTIPHIEIALRYFCLLMTAVLFLTIVIIIQGRLRSKRPIRTIPPFQRNISGLDALIQ